MENVNNTGTKKVALWNKRHFEEKNGECAACLKYSVIIAVEKIYKKCNIWRVAVRPSYIQDARLLKVKIWFRTVHHTYTNKNLIKYAATLPNYTRRCILIDYFNKSNFSKLE
jgi:hypothetical protein